MGAYCKNDGRCVQELPCLSISIAYFVVVCEKKVLKWQNH